jgi:hypothetical protein
MRTFRRAYLWLIPLALLATTAAFAQGGPWWPRTQAATPEQQALVDRVTELHQQIRAKQLELNALRLQGADEKQIAAKEKEVTQLRETLHKKLADNAEAITRMVPSPVAPGAGFAPGWGAGRGWGAGPGWRGGFGAGPGYGRGLGMGYGRGMGLGPGYGLGLGYGPGWCWRTW